MNHILTIHLIKDPITPNNNKIMPVLLHLELDDIRVGYHYVPVTSYLLILRFDVTEGPRD